MLMFCPTTSNLLALKSALPIRLPAISSKKMWMVLCSSMEEQLRLVIKTLTTIQEGLIP